MRRRYFPQRPTEAELDDQLKSELKCSEDVETVVLQAVEWSKTPGAVIKNHSFCLTKGRYLGWVPRATEEGDIIAIFKNAKTPFVLRPVVGSTDESFTFVGECYIHGIMYGEAMEKNLEKCTFRIHLDMIESNYIQIIKLANRTVNMS